MQFIYPEFLFALSVLAIPIIIHLFNFRRFKKIYFTNVRFLKEIKQDTQSRSRLNHLLVLLSRLLALTFLVFAFAQPFIPAKTNKVQSGTKRVSIYVDKAKVKTDNELFKKLKGEIWEFRTLYNKTYFRILAFWDKEDKQQTLVLTTHGIIKKTEKTPEKEIEKAEQIRLKYFELKNSRKDGNKK